jgi:serine protease Do
MAGLAASGLAIHAHHIGLRHNAEVGFALGALALVGAGVAWESRPDFTEVQERLEEQLRAEMAADDVGVIEAAVGGAMACVLQPERSRVTGAAAADVPFEWSEDGCVNRRTQYGQANGAWSRLFVPADEAVVSVNAFDPATREYRVDRYLLDREALESVRDARGEFQAPACGAGDTAVREFGAQQAGVLSLLPARPNERLVYKCSAARS